MVKPLKLVKNDAIVPFLSCDRLAPKSRDFGLRIVFADSGAPLAPADDCRHLRVMPETSDLRIAIGFTFAGMYTIGQTSHTLCFAQNESWRQSNIASHICFYSWR
jgi:hypothetical protein